MRMLETFSCAFEFTNDEFERIVAWEKGSSMSFCRHLETRLSHVIDIQWDDYLDTTISISFKQPKEAVQDDLTLLISIISSIIL